MELAPDGRRIGAFREKPEFPLGVPGDPDQAMVSMGNYVFDAKVLVEAVTTDSKDGASSHDVGGDIIPMLVDRGEAQVFDFASHFVPGVSEREHGYWRDIGTLDAYYDANMDLCRVNPDFNLYDPEWPLRTHQVQAPPAKFVFADDGRTGLAIPTRWCAQA
jgi:glucose-1-phosphate adenylyltransferase